MGETLFFGEQEVLETTEGTEGTLRVKLKINPPKKNEDGSEDVAETIDIPKWEFDACAKSIIANAGDMRNSRANQVALEILLLLKKLDVRVEEIGYYMTKVMDSLQMTEQNVVLKVHGIENKYDLRLSHWNKKLID